MRTTVGKYRRLASSWGLLGELLSAFEFTSARDPARFFKRYDSLDLHCTVPFHGSASGASELRL